MSFAPWLRGCQVRLTWESRPLFSTCTRTARRVQLVVEQLEDRWLPSYGLTTLATFNGANGSSPYPMGGLVEDSKGNLFGTTTKGGASGAGTVFELAAGSSSITTLASFNGTNGSDPQAGLVKDSKGNLFGTTTKGGASGAGTVFELAAGSSSITTLASFNGTNGSDPIGSLVEDSNGDLFGTTVFGGANGEGAVFEVAAGSSITTLASFNGTNGSEPQAGVVEDSNGNLFGTAEWGGANNDGTLFEVAAGSSSITTLASFNSTNGANPLGNLLEDSHGNLFGTTYYGGANGAGTVFEVAAGSNSITTLASFSGNREIFPQGGNPQGGLIEDSNGNLFGTAYEAENGSYWGMVFEWIKSTDTLSAIATFNGSSGFQPNTGLVLGSNGSLIGTTEEGDNNDGTVFVLTPVPAETVGVFDPATATWYLNGSNTAGPPTAGEFTYGGANWVALSGDFTGDGQTTVALVDLSTETWYIRNSDSAGAPSITPFQYGAPGWIPVVGDWDGSGMDGIGVVDPTTGTWYLDKLIGGLPNPDKFTYGAPGWIPVVGNWAGNADGRDGIGMVDPSTETWYLRNTPDAGAVSYTPFQYGAPGWTPLAGNWTDSNQTGIGVYDGTGTFYLRNELSSGNPDAGQFAYGAGGWTPLAGQWQNLTASGQLQLAAGIGPGAPSISNAVLQSTVQEALTLVRTDGANPLLLQELASANYTLAVLPPGVLGETFVQCNTVEISPDAAGFGWYVDASPNDPAFDANETAPAGGPAAGHEDLLTTVLHEIGHLAGQADVANASTGSNLMDTVLPLGTRRIDALDLVFANGTFV